MGRWKGRAHSALPEATCTKVRRRRDRHTIILSVAAGAYPPDARVLDAGGWKCGRKEGRGILTYSGGDVFEAHYVAGVKEGKYWYRRADGVSINAERGLDVYIRVMPMQLRNSAILHVAGTLTASSRRELTLKASRRGTACAGVPTRRAHAG